MIQFGSLSIDLASILSAAATLVGAVAAFKIGAAKRKKSRQTDDGENP